MEINFYFIIMYKDPLLKYPLTKIEYEMIDKVWDFLKEFNIGTMFVSDYRKKIIKTIRDKYTINDFQLYEGIAEKLFWNMRWILFPLFYFP